MSTAAEIISRVRGRLPATSVNFWTDELDLIPAYNDALDELSEATEFYERYATVPRRKWAVYTDLRGILPEEVTRITAVWNPITSRWLRPITVRELDLTVGRKWEANIDLARAWWVRGLYWLGAYPRAGDDISPLRVYFSAMHPHVSSTAGPGYGLTASPEIPHDFEIAIEEYMLYALYAPSKETQRCMRHWQEYKLHETRFKAFVDNRISRDRTPKIGARR